MAAAQPTAAGDSTRDAEAMVEALLGSEPITFLFSAGKSAGNLYKMPLEWRVRFCRALHLRAVSGGGGLRGDSSEGEFTVLEDILLNTRGTELTALKLALDSMDDSVQHDLVNLYMALGQMPDGERRTARLLAHFRREAVAALRVWHAHRRQEYWNRMQALGLPADAVAAARGDPSAQPRLKPSWPVMVFSDFDDTMMAKLFDYSFPGSVAYPGAAAFLRAMQGEFGGRVGIRPGHEGGGDASSVACSDNSASTSTLAPASAEGGTSASPDDPPVLSETDVHVRRRKRDQLRDWMKGWMPGSGSGSSSPTAAAASDGPTGPPPVASGSTPINDTRGSSPAGAAAAKAGAALASVALPGALEGPSGGEADDAEEAAQAAKKAAEDAAAERTDCPVLRLESGDLRAAAAPSPASTTAASPAAAAAAVHLDGASGAVADASEVHCTGTGRECSDACLESATGHLGISATVYLSARPDMMKEKTLASTTAILGHPPQAILCGTFRTLASNAGMAARKAENYKLYHALFPEFRVVWLGDSGQGDIATGLQMLRIHEQDEADAAAEAAATAVVAVDAGVDEEGMACGSGSVRWWPPPAPLVLIHDVCASNQTPYSDEAKRAALLAAGVHIFDSYADAACLAFEHLLLSESALRSVLDAVTRELPSIVFRSPEQRAARLADYHRAMRRCRAAMLAHDDRRCLVQALPAPLQALLPSARTTSVAVGSAAPSPVWAGADGGAGAMVAAV
jgi:hypothetical protein